MVQYLPVVVAVSRNKVKTYSEAKIVPKSWARLKLSNLLGSLFPLTKLTRVDLVTDSLSTKLPPTSGRRQSGRYYWPPLLRVFLATDSLIENWGSSLTY